MRLGHAPDERQTGRTRPTSRAPSTSRSTLKKRILNHTEIPLIRYGFIEFPSSARQSCSPQIKKNGNPKILGWHHSCGSFMEVFLILRVISKQFSTLIIICYQSTNRGVVTQLIVHSRRPKASPTFIWWT